MQLQYWIQNACHKKSNCTFGVIFFKKCGAGGKQSNLQNITRLVVRLKCVYVQKRHASDNLNTKWKRE